MHLLNGCAPDALVRNSFVSSLRAATSSSRFRSSTRHCRRTIGLATTRGRPRSAGPAVEAEDQLAPRLRPCPHLSERPRLPPPSTMSAPDWPTSCEDNSGLLSRTSRSDFTVVIAQAQALESNLNDRLRASTALDREASARFAQQATSLHGKKLVGLILKTLKVCYPLVASVTFNSTYEN